MNNVTVINDIKFIEESLNINDSQFAAQIGISRMSINRWRKGEKISKNNFEKIYSFAYKSGLRINEIKAQMFLDNQKNGEKILFHGAKNEINENLNVDYSKQNNDFGKGIYLGEDFFQSASFVSNSLNSMVYIVKFNNKQLKIVNYNVDEEWMLTIAYFRNRLYEYVSSNKLKPLIDKVNKADVIIAPIADNQMYSILNDFVSGDITNLQCEKSLSATNLGKQYCFKNNKASKDVKVICECYLCDAEKTYYIQKKSEQTDIGLQKVKYIKREYAGKGKYIEELL